VSAGLHGKPIDCSAVETSVFNPPAGQTCGAYMANYLTAAPGNLQNPGATANCQYCSLSNADQFLAGTGIVYSQIWVSTRSTSTIISTKLTWFVAQFRHLLGVHHLQHRRSDMPVLHLPRQEVQLG
jgi:ABC-type multidrug transport system permease subunit